MRCLERPLPIRSGSVDAPLNAPGEVLFDSLGEPHIRAANLEDALFLQGYVTAQDRLWQMDSLRRLAGGNLAEILGPIGLEPDRRSGVGRARQDQLGRAGRASGPCPGTSEDHDDHRQNVRQRVPHVGRRRGEQVHAHQC